MEVSTYIFQSPYPSSVQVGRPDPLAEKEDNQNSDLSALSQTNSIQGEYSSMFIKQSSLASSINVAVRSIDSVLSDSLDTFSSLNAQAKAINAFA